MKTMAILTFLMGFSFATAQTPIEQKRSYLKTAYSTREVKEKKAVFLKTETTYNSGERLIEIEHIKTGEISLREIYKNGRPVGEWMELDDRNNRIIRNFDDIPFTDEKLILPAVNDSSYSDTISPIIYKKSAGQIIYPRRAVILDIQGVVTTRIKIEQDGQVTLVAVQDDCDPYLTFEACRVIKEVMAIRLPKGHSLESTFITLPIRFRLR